MKRKALGKGLRSLIPDTPPPAVATRTKAGDGLAQIDIDRIQPNPEQPRMSIAAEALEELAESVRAQGILQPVIVRPLDGGSYELVAGERRWRAAQIAGLLKIPAIVRDTKQDRLLEIALIENLQREDLDPVEEAGAYQALILELGLTQEEVAKRVGKKRATIANALRVLNLPAEVQELIRGGRISLGHAKVLASLAQTSAQLELARRIAREGWSVRQVERRVAASRRADSPGKSGKPPVRDPNVVAAEDKLQRALATKVRIVSGRGGRGKLELFFHGDEELERLYQLILGAVRSSPARRRGSSAKGS